MNIHGISDSLVTVTDESAICASCGGAVRVRGGSCVSCLLLTGLEEGDDGGGKETFEAVLAEIDVPDRDWRIGNYVILEEIGRGGMGVIYRAQQRHSRRIVALKRLLAYHGDSRDTLERFRREAEAAASLDHPNILPIYEVAEAEGLPFFTMKYAIGGSLQRAAAALSADPRECARLLAKVTRAVAFAHREGILHRDLKPGNILLDGRGEPLVSDFGLAKWMDTSSDLTRSLAVYGTPGFIAPEQAHGAAASLTPAADIYSLGAILFDLLAGRPPFLGEHALAVIRQAADKPAPKLRSLLRNVDRDLETICAKCLERDPAARYRSAADLAEDLERWLDGRPIIARPVSPPVTLWRWSKRNPLLATAALACALASGIAVTRQLDNWRFQREITAQFAAQHSVEVVPLIDLDTMTFSDAWTRKVADALVADLKTFGPATVHVRQGLAPEEKASLRKAGAKTSARTLLAGTIRTINGNTRASLHLLDATNGEPLLHRVIEVDPASATPVRRNAFAEVYGILATADLSTRVQRPPDPGLLDPVAREFIDAGLALAYRRGATDFERGIGCLQRALELQPGSAAAHAGLAKIMSLKAAYGSNREPIAPALELARKAVALNPTSADARLALAAVLYQRDHLTEAKEEALTSIEYCGSIRRGLSLLHNIHKATGRADLALAAYALRPRDDATAADGSAAAADALVLLLDDARAESTYHHYAALHPDKPDGWVGLCWLRILQGRLQEARAIYHARAANFREFVYADQMAAQVEFFARNFPEAENLYTQLYDRDPEGGGSFYAAASYASMLGRLKMESDPVRGREILEQARLRDMERVERSAENPTLLYRLAAIEASLGATEAAFRYLAATTSAGWIDFRSAAVDPRFDAISKDPRFDEQLSRMKARVAEQNRTRSGSAAFAHNIE